MLIFDADDPLVLNGTYDREGYTPNERRAQRRKEEQMARRGSQKSGQAREVNAILEAAAAMASDGVVHDNGDGPLPMPPVEAPKAMPVEETTRTQLKVLSETYEAVAAAQTRYDERAKAAKSAKTDLEEKTTTLLSVVRRLVQVPELPLFDQVQAEQDLAAMTSAATLPAGPEPDEDAPLEAEAPLHAWKALDDGGADA